MKTKKKVQEREQQPPDVRAVARKAANPNTRIMVGNCEGSRSRLCARPRRRSQIPRTLIRNNSGINFYYIDVS